ncbi:hypothetical protein I551_4225 [Mycobacterium ulcerans str. Harvey]|uniref:Uncharacterized protein n=1 Tax=Mycobacterium ulcerans str. Harvey TaxID=1299332 RepID=A0ABN0QXC2_MYCUL|nr:hypothetical protein I551_4225 [Mycobacterium ulcerans str. Harvey]
MLARRQPSCADQRVRDDQRMNGTAVGQQHRRIAVTNNSSMTRASSTPDRQHRTEHAAPPRAGARLATLPGGASYLARRDAPVNAHAITPRGFAAAHSFYYARW